MSSGGGVAQTHSITLSDAITNIEVIKRGHFQKFLSDLGESHTLDLGLADISMA